MFRTEAEASDYPRGNSKCRCNSKCRSFDCGTHGVAVSAFAQDDNFMGAGRAVTATARAAARARAAATATADSSAALRNDNQSGAAGPLQQREICSSFGSWL